MDVILRSRPVGLDGIISRVVLTQTLPGILFGAISLGGIQIDTLLFYSLDASAVRANTYRR